MSARRFTRTLITLPLSVAALAASASSLLAQGRPLFDWSGRVDREVRITMHGRDARTQTAGRIPLERSRLDVAGALPQQDGRVTVRVQDGRGDVDVVQQPSARNDYTMIMRIADRSSGVDNYRVTAYWTPDEYRGGNRTAMARGMVATRADTRFARAVVAMTVTIAMIATIAETVATATTVVGDMATATAGMAAARTMSAPFVGRGRSTTHSRSGSRAVTSTIAR